MICAFEPSTPARLAAQTAAWMAAALQAPLVLIHVFDEGAQPALPQEGALMDPTLRQQVADQRDDRLRASAGAALDTLADELSRADASRLVLEGRVVPTLLAAATAHQAQLLVCGTAARSGIHHVLQGSVAGRLAAEAPCPVVAVPPAAQIHPGGPVLVVDDGSDHSHRAVRHATALAGRLGRDLLRVEAGDEDAVEVVGKATRERACLIAAGTRGRGSLRAELFGSLALALVKTGARPVMLVSASAGEPV